MRQVLIALIKLYRYAISPYLAPSCRYTPTCSSYAIEAVDRFGVFRGSWMAMRRISRCHPWHEGGYDPVPENNDTTITRRHH
jgi:hypothetical protein